MIERFSGVENKRLLYDALLAQFIVNNDGVIADELVNKLELKEFKPGDVIISEGGSDNDLYLILSGLVSVKVKDRELARRGSSQHIGEMALIDVSASRSATVIASDLTVAAMITEADFSEIASKFPVLWRRLALLLAERLRERSSFVRPKNETPKIFIGSSVEGLDPARSIQTGLAYDPFITQIWTDDIFKASKTSIENLLVVAETADFGVLILSPDDKIETRQSTFIGPRDNVVFELGLLMGAIGRERVFIVKEKNAQIKIPTDLLGVTLIEYQSGKEDTLAARLSFVCSEIRSTVKKLGSR